MMNPRFLQFMQEQSRLRQAMPAPPMRQPMPAPPRQLAPAPPLMPVIGPPAPASAMVPVGPPAPASAFVPGMGPRTFAMPPVFPRNPNPVMSAPQPPPVPDDTAAGATAYARTMENPVEQQAAEDERRRQVEAAMAARATQGDETARAQSRALTPWIAQSETEREQAAYLRTPEGQAAVEAQREVARVEAERQDAILARSDQARTQYGAQLITLRNSGAGEGDAAYDEALANYERADEASWVATFAGNAAREATGDTGLIALAFNALDAPRAAVATQVGERMHRTATGEEGTIQGALDAVTPGGGGEATRWAADPDNRKAIVEAHANGYNGFTGDRAVWELYVGTRAMPMRALYDTAMDPTNLLEGLGALARGSNAAGVALRNAPDASRAARVGGATLQATGAVANAGDVALNRIPEAVIGGAFNLARRAAESVPGLRTLVEPTQRVVEDRRGGAVRDALLDARRTQNLPPPPGITPPPAAGTPAGTPPGGAPAAQTPPAAPSPYPAPRSVPTASGGNTVYTPERAGTVAVGPEVVQFWAINPGMPASPSQGRPGANLVEQVGNAQSEVYLLRADGGRGGWTLVAPTANGGSRIVRQGTNLTEGRRAAADEWLARNNPAASIILPSRMPAPPSEPGTVIDRWGGRNRIAPSEPVIIRAPESDPPLEPISSPPGTGQVPLPPIDPAAPQTANPQSPPMPRTRQQTLADQPLSPPPPPRPDQVDPAVQRWWDSTGRPAEAPPPTPPAQAPLPEPPATVVEPSAAPPAGTTLGPPNLRAQLLPAPPSENIGDANRLRPVRIPVEEPPVPEPVVTPDPAPRPERPVTASPRREAMRSRQGTRLIDTLPPETHQSIYARMGEMDPRLGDRQAYYAAYNRLPRVEQALMEAEYEVALRRAAIDEGSPLVAPWSPRFGPNSANFEIDPAARIEEMMRLDPADFDRVINNLPGGRATGQPETDTRAYRTTIKDRARTLNRQLAELRDPVMPVDAAPAVPDVAMPETAMTPQGEQNLLPGTRDARRPTFDRPTGGITLPEQTTVPSAEGFLQRQVADTPEARREARVLDGQADMFAPSPPRPAATPTIEPERPSAIDLDGPSPADVPAAADPDVPAVTAPAPEGLEDYRRVSRSAVRVDPASFQMRKKLYAETSVENIVTTYTEDRAKFRRKFQPIEVREDADGTFTVLSGHSRLEAANRLDLDDVPIRIVRGTDDEITEAALTSNTLGTALTPSEHGRNLRRQIEMGKTFDQARADAKLTKTKADQYVAVSHLPEDLQELVDTKGNLLSEANGAVLGGAVRDGVITPADAQAFYTNRMTKKRYSADQLKNVFSAMQHAQTRLDVSQGDMFAGLNLADVSNVSQLDTLDRLGRELSALEKGRRDLGRAAKNVNASPETKASLERDIGGIKRRITTLERDLGLSDEITPDITPGGAMPETMAADGPITAAYATGPLNPATIMGLMRGGRDTGRAVKGGAVKTYGALRAATAPEPRATDLAPVAQDAALVLDSSRREMSRVWKRHPTHANKTTGEVFAELRVEAERAIQEAAALQAKGVTFPTSQQQRKRGRITPDQKAYLDLWKEWGQPTDIKPGDMGTADATDMAIVRTSYESMIDAGRDPDFVPNLWTDFLGATSQTLLAQPYWLVTRYLSQNVLGNQVLSTLGQRTVSRKRVGAIASAGDLRIVAARSGRKIAGMGADPTARTTSEKKFIEWGRPPGGRTEFGVTKSDAIDQGALRRMLRRIKVGDISWAANGNTVSDLAGPYEKSGAYVRSIEEAQKQGLVAIHVEDAMDVRAPAFRTDAIARARNVGGAQFADAVSKAIKDLPTDAGADRYLSMMRQEMKGAGVSGMDGQAIRIARDWMERTNVMLDEAVRETERVMPGLSQMKIDQVLGNIVPFSFYNTRVAKYQLETMASHPGLAAAFWRAQDGMERWEQDNPDAPTWLKGMVRVAHSPFGYMVYADPMRLLLSSFFTGEGGGFNTEDMNTLERSLFEVSKYTGLTLWPVHQTGLSVTGIAGQDLAVPNPIPVPVFRMLGHVIDAVGVWSGAGPGDPALMRFLGNAREQITKYGPGETVYPIDPAGARRERIGDMVVERNPDLNARLESEDASVAADAQAELNTILGDPDDPQYVAAERVVFTEPVVRDQINQVSPIPVTTRQDETDTRRSVASREAAPGEPVPSSSRERAAEEQGAIVNTPDPDAQAVRLGQSQQRAVVQENLLGSEVNQRFNAILFGNATYGVTLGHGDQTERYTAEQVNAMGDPEREVLADRWLAAHTHRAPARDEFVTARDEVRAENPTYAKYPEWQGDLYGYEGGPQAWWEEAVRTNPNAARWYDEQMTRLEQKHEGVPLTDPAYVRDVRMTLTGEDAYFAWSGTRGSRYDSPSLTVNDPTTQPVNPASPGGSGGGGFGEWTPERAAEELSADVADYQLANDRVSQLINAGNAPGESVVSFDQLAGFAQDAYRQRFPDLMPKENARVTDYLTWVAAQPAGTDTSTLAYVRGEETRKEMQKAREAADFAALLGSVPSNPYAGPVSLRESFYQPVRPPLAYNAQRR